MTSFLTTQPRQHIAKYDGNNYVTRVNTFSKLGRRLTLSHASDHTPLNSR